MIKLPPIITHAYILLTEGCNCRCEYCYVKNRDIINEIPMEYIDKLIKSFTCYNKPRIIFFGGEPTLKQSIIRQVVEKYGDSLHYQIVTNGTYHFHDFLENIWRPIKDNFDIQVSWDGSDDTRLKANGDISNQSVYNIMIEELKNGAEFEGRCVLNEYSVMNFYQTYKTFKKLNSQYHFSGDFTIAHQLSFPRSFHIELRKNLDLILNDIKNDLNNGTDVFFSRFILKEISNVIQNKPIISCDIGNYVVLKPNGDIYPCTILAQQDERFKLGNIKNNIDTEIITDIRYKSSCLKDCDYKSVCDGGCRYERMKNFGEEWKCKVCSHTCDIYKEIYESIKNFLNSLNDNQRENLYYIMSDYNMWQVDYNNNRI